MKIVISLWAPTSDPMQYTEIFGAGYCRVEADVPEGSSIDGAEFPEALADWGVIAAVGIAEEVPPPGRRRFTRVPLTTPVVVSKGDKPRIDVSFRTVKVSPRRAEPDLALVTPTTLEEAFPDE